jgi:hypothetical protein
MSSLREMKVEQALTNGAELGYELNVTPAEITNATRKSAKFILQIAAMLANLPANLPSSDLEALQNALVSSKAPNDLGTMPRDKLRELCEEIRTVWDDFEQRLPRKENPTRAYAILKRWWENEHDLYNRERWFVNFATGTIFPTFLNYHALIASAIYSNQDYLGKCAGCSQYFVKVLKTSKYCKACYRYSGANRQKEYRQRQAAKLKAARKSRKRA